MVLGFLPSTKPYSNASVAPIFHSKTIYVNLSFRSHWPSKAAWRLVVYSGLVGLALQLCFGEPWFNDPFLVWWVMLHSCLLLYSLSGIRFEGREYRCLRVNHPWVVTEIKPKLHTAVVIQVSGGIIDCGWWIHVFRTAFLKERAVGSPIYFSACSPFSFGNGSSRRLSPVPCLLALVTFKASHMSMVCPRYYPGQVLSQRSSW